MHNLEKIHFTAAEILAAATFEMFPEIELIEGSICPSGFYYDFYFPHPTPPELLSMLEMKMRQIIQEKREIQEVEMVAASAKGFLISRGHSNLAQRIEGPGLFSLIQVGKFINLSNGIYLDNTEHLEAFVLTKVSPLGGKKVRIFGSAFSSKQELKLFLKKNKQYPQIRHEKKGEIKRYWKEVDGELVWLREGLLAKEKLINRIKQSLCPEATEVKSMRGSSFHKQLIELFSCHSISEEVFETDELMRIEQVGWLDSSSRTTLFVTTILEREISLLQSIQKTLSMLGFEYSVSVTVSKKGVNRFESGLKSLGIPYKSMRGKDPRIAFCVADGLGREWVALEVTASDCLTVQVNIERNLALLLYITN